MVDTVSGDPPDQVTSEEFVVGVKVILHARNTGRVLLCLLNGRDGEAAYWSTFGCELDLARNPAFNDAFVRAVQLSVSAQAGHTGPFETEFLATSENELSQYGYYIAHIDTEFEHADFPGILRARWFMLDDIKDVDAPISSGLFAVLTLPRSRSLILGEQAAVAVVHH